MTHMPVVGDHDELKAELTGVIEPGSHGFGRTGTVARNEGVVAIEQDRALTRRPQGIEVDVLDARDVAAGGKDAHRRYSQDF